MTFVPSDDDATDTQLAHGELVWVHTTPTKGMQFPVPSLGESAGQTPVPDTPTPALPPGVAERVTVPVPATGRVGENTMCTVQAVPGTRVVLPDTQSKAPPVWTAKSALSGVRVIAPLVCWPLFRIVKLSGLLDWPVVTEPKSRLKGETERLAGVVADTSTAPASGTASPRPLESDGAGDRFRRASVWDGQASPTISRLRVGAGPSAGVRLRGYGRVGSRFGDVARSGIPALCICRSDCEVRALATGVRRPHIHATVRAKAWSFLRKLAIWVEIRRGGADPTYAYLLGGAVGA